MKLTDVGVAKHEQDISGTFCGTLLYSAPEVKDGQVYDTKADMYSFGMIMWEMWYAETAFQSDLTSRTQSQLLNDIRKGLRPKHIEGTRQPWGMWQSVMKTCWDNEPHNRLTAEQSWGALKKLQQLQEQEMHSGLPTQHDPLPETSQSKSTAERRPNPSKPKPPIKPRPAAPKQQPRSKPPIPAPKPKRTSVAFSNKPGDKNIHFQ